jgi:xyloglucan:xyloglucosyl transferase
MLRLAAIALAVVLVWLPASAAAAVDVTATVPFQEVYTPLFGFDNILRSADDRTVSLLLDRSTGAYHNFFSRPFMACARMAAGLISSLICSVVPLIEIRVRARARMNE